MLKIITLANHRSANGRSDSSWKFADCARICTTGREASALTALLYLHGSWAAVVARVGRSNRSSGQSSVRMVFSSLGVSLVFVDVSSCYLAMQRRFGSHAHSTSLFDAGAKKWALNHTYVRLIKSMMMPCFT